MRLFVYIFLMFCACNAFSEAIIISHNMLQSYEKNGNILTGIATPSLGAQQSEIWNSSIAIGSQTLKHKHNVEEIVILLAGELEVVVEDKTSKCEAPCSIILPANKYHVLKNTGTIPTQHYLVMPAKSGIHDEIGNELNLPWRR